MWVKPRRRGQCAHAFRLSAMLVGAAAALGIAGCDVRHTDIQVEHPGAELWARGPSISRHVDAIRWDTAYVLGGSTRDTLLRYPTRVASTVAATYVYDAGTARLIALDSMGRVKWQLGPSRSDSLGLRNMRDLKVSPSGTVSLLDPGNDRMLWIDTTGKLVRSVPLSAVGHVDQHVPLSHGRTVLLSMDDRSPFKVIDSSGRILSEMAFPWAGYAALSAVARQGQIASDPTAGDWTFTFTEGDGWFAFDSTNQRPFIGRYITHGEFPNAVKRSTTKGSVRIVSTKVARPWIAAPSAALADSLLYVLYGGKTASGTIVDRYSAKGGEYLGSVILPVHARAIAVHGDSYYVIASGAVPEVLALHARS